VWHGGPFISAARRITRDLGGVKARQVEKKRKKNAETVDLRKTKKPEEKKKGRKKAAGRKNRGH